VEEFSAGSGAEGVQALPESAFELVGSHGETLPRGEVIPRDSSVERCIGIDSRSVATARGAQGSQPSCYFEVSFPSSAAPPPASQAGRLGARNLTRSALEGRLPYRRPRDFPRGNSEEHLQARDAVDALELE
jgi:hypothetical protein